MAVDQRKIKGWFGRHVLSAPTGDAYPKADEIRMALENAADVILRNTPIGPEQSRAVTELRNVLDIAVRAIKCVA